MHVICNECFRSVGPIEELTIGLLGDHPAECMYCGRSSANATTHRLRGEGPDPEVLLRLYRKSLGRAPIATPEDPKAQKAPRRLTREQLLESVRTEIGENAYLVSKGVRPLYAQSFYDLGEEFEEAAKETLHKEAEKRGLCSFFERDDKGFAISLSQHQWAIDAYRWLHKSSRGKEVVALVGLLHGYGPREIQEFVDKNFQQPPKEK